MVHLYVVCCLEFDNSVEELLLQTERERELERSNVEMEKKIQQLEQKILELEFAISGKLYLCGLS